MSRTPSRRSARRALLVAPALAAGALLLAACSPTTTTLPYSPSDGRRVDVEPQLRGLNLLVVTTEEGEAGNLLGALTNDSADDVEFTLAADGADAVTVPVAGGQTVYLGTEDGEDLQLDAVSVAPGGVVPATLSVDGTSVDFTIPVLDGTLPEYAPYVP